MRSESLIGFDAKSLEEFVGLIRYNKKIQWANITSIWTSSITTTQSNQFDIYKRFLGSDSIFL